MATATAQTNQTTKAKEVECPRCAGRGHIESFSHIKNGECFLCSGNKTIFLSDKLTRNVKIEGIYTHGLFIEFDDNGNGRYVFTKKLVIIIDNKHSQTIDILESQESRQLARDYWAWIKGNGGVINDNHGRRNN